MTKRATQLNRLRAVARPFVPAAVRLRLALWLSRIDPAFKKNSELSFWVSRLKEEGCPANEPGYYAKFMMDMGGIADPSFFDDKVCLDIGCGPRGSLTWLANARARIGVDPLADAYMEFGIGRHPMVYLACGVEQVPLPSRYVDVVFSMNSLDHVDDIKAACREIRRILKPGGHFIASLNLDEPRSITEPWTLSEAFLAKNLFRGWTREFYELRPKCDPDLYRYFYTDCPQHLMNRAGPKALWCRMRAD